jgi:hypothetical protein
VTGSAVDASPTVRLNLLTGLSVDGCELYLEVLS